jgi:hypothetical protein
MSSLIELLVLGLLRYIGRGWTFDDIKEQTAISNEVHRLFFHTFIDFLIFAVTHSFAFAM